MITIMTETRVKPGQEQEWEHSFTSRLEKAHEQPGWISAQLLIPSEDSQKRIVLGNWKDRDSWRQWHDTEVFKRTRKGLDAATESRGESRWFDCSVEDFSSA